MQKVLPRIQVKETLDNLKGGTIYSVTFVKKDGTLRVMNSIKNTHKGIKGVGLKFDANERGFVPVYDLQLAKANHGTDPSKCWRMINLNTVQKIVINKEEYLIQD